MPFGDVQQPSSGPTGASCADFPAYGCLRGNAEDGGKNGLAHIQRTADLFDLGWRQFANRFREMRHTTGQLALGMLDGVREVRFQIRKAEFREISFVFSSFISDSLSNTSLPAPA